MAADFEWVGSFVYCQKVDDFELSEDETHYTLIEDVEDRHDNDDNSIAIDSRDFVCGWLYQDSEYMFVQWSSVEYYVGDAADQKLAEERISKEYGKPVRVTDGNSQWLDGYTYAKIAAPNRANGSWPRSYNWLTSWVYLPQTTQVLMSADAHQAHEDVIEAHEDATGTDVNLNQSFEVGVLLRNEFTQEIVIYPEYSDWASGNGYDEVPQSDDAVIRMVAAKAESLGWSPITGVLRDDEDGEGTVYRISKFKPKKPKRRHLHKEEQFGYHKYHGCGGFISRWGGPPIGGGTGDGDNDADDGGVGGQVDTTTAKIAAGILIKFVSLPDKFLVGEDTHHMYLLEAEYGIGEFPSDTNAIGRAWLENDTITGIGFDFGTQSSQQYAIKQLREWAHKEGYETSPSLIADIDELANVS